jgi:hypothetical protein
MGLLARGANLSVLRAARQAAGEEVVMPAILASRSWPAGPAPPNRYWSSSIWYGALCSVGGPQQRMCLGDGIGSDMLGKVLVRTR